jgi:hypothetical protein
MTEPDNETLPQECSRIDFELIANNAFDSPVSESMREEFGDHFGFSSDSLVRLGIGAWPLRKPTSCTIPERDAQGAIVGITKWYPPDKYREMARSAPGLYYDPEWKEADGPVILVKGPSETLAWLTLGHCAIGRSATMKGQDSLFQLLNGTSRRLIVVGSNDKRLHDSLPQSVRKRHNSECRGCAVCFPSRHECELAAKELSFALDVPVDCGFPPTRIKDACNWLISEANDTDKAR